MNEFDNYNQYYESVTTWWDSLHDYSKMKILSSIGESPNPDIKFNELLQDVKHQVFQIYLQQFNDDDIYNENETTKKDIE